MEVTDAMRERLRHFFIHYSEPPRPLSAREGSGSPSHRSQGLGDGGGDGGTGVVSAGRSIYLQEVDCLKLLDVCPELGSALLNQTAVIMRTLCGESAALCKEAGQMGIRSGDISLRLTHVPVAVTGVPSVPPAEGQLVQLSGSIIRMTTKRVVPHASRLMCPRCRAMVEVFTNPFDRAAEAKAQCTQPACKHEPMQVIGQVWMDYAECRLQQRSNQSGRLPRSMLVTLDDELSMKCAVGQFVEVVGLAFPKWRHVSPSCRPAIEPAIWAVNVQPMEAYRGAATTTSGAPGLRRRAGRTDRPKFNPEHFFLSFGKDKWRRGVALARSVCPHLSGLFAPRLAVLLSALGGASTSGKTAMHVRSTIHCLYVGDPSTGKTQLLRYAAAIAPRSTTTTGMGSTSAGLTVAAAKEHGEWVLEPGALVLSDGGSCIIDELRTVSPADRASLHEAMEQQTISVAKGGLVTKLRTACAVLSACNPPARHSGRTEIGVGGPLLSRFDFIFLLWDTPQPDVDARIAAHLLRANTGAQTVLKENELTVDEVARYVWWVRTQYASMDGPLLSDSAADLLGRYYEIQRLRGPTPALDDAVPVTVRFLESLVRLTQAYAKMHLQAVCTVEDAAMAVFLMERSAYSLKCPLEGVSRELYSSSRELDEVFLSDDDVSIVTQSAVLATLADVIFHYRLPLMETSERPAEAGGEGVPLADLPFMRAMRVDRLSQYTGSAFPASIDPPITEDPGNQGEGVAQTLLEQRHASSALLQARTLAALSSAARLSEEVGRTSGTAYSVSRYAGSSLERVAEPSSAAAYLRSQRVISTTRDVEALPTSSLSMMSMTPAPVSPSPPDPAELEAEDGQHLEGRRTQTIVVGQTAEEEQDGAEPLLLDSEQDSRRASSGRLSPTSRRPSPPSAVPPISFFTPISSSLAPNGRRKRSADDIMRSLRFRP